MNTIMELLNAQMTKPAFYGSMSESWFQYLSLIVFFVTMVVLTKKYKHANEVQLTNVIKIFAYVLIAFELYKQINYTYTNNWAYRWYAFPFQFCSTPMYVALIASYMKKSSIRDALYMFLATYGFFAGIAVMLYPISVYTTTIGINIQTMVHHGGMAVLGMILLAYHVPHTFKAFMKGTYVFTFLTGIAILLNGIHNTWITEGTFNMFFINPLYTSEIPVLSLFQPLVPNAIYIVIFIIGFSVVAYIMLLGRKAAPKLKNMPQTIKNFVLKN